MSLLHYFKTKDKPSPSHPLLPKPRSSVEASANAAVISSMDMTRKKRRGLYSHYDAGLRAKMGRYAAENGNKAAANFYSAKLGRPVPESTIRGMKASYLRVLEEVKDPLKVTELQHKLRGRPLKLGEYDGMVKDYIHALRLAGGIVNRSIVVAAATGIIEHLDPSRLSKHGGDITIEHAWAKSFLSRLGFVRRKGTKAARKLPSDYEDIKASFLERVREAATTSTGSFIPPQLILNFDQTNAKFVPVSEWTLEKSGTKQVSIVGLEDKREMTVLLCCTLSGELLSPQLIYAGKTERCHPSVCFPDGWNITHSPNHWSTQETMMEFLDKILIPYVQQTRERMELPPTFPAVAIFDVFAAHRCQPFLDVLTANKIQPVFVPAGCTGELQPLDITVNAVFKRELKSSFSSWYAKQVSESLKNGKDIASVKVNLAISTIKPLHANWLMHVIIKIGAQHDTIRNGFEKVGVSTVFFN